MAGSKIGGYDVSLISAITGKSKCPFCKLLMRDPIQTFRGEMSCESCYINARGNSKTCPIDGEPIDEGNEFFKDKFARGKILQLECYCLYQDNGCPWKGVVKDVEEHASKCKFRGSLCAHCKEMFEANRLRSHQATCHLKPMQCPYKCGQLVSLNVLSSHVEKCPKIIGADTCPYQPVGCTYQPRNNDDMREHLLMANNAHASLTVVAVASLQLSNDSILKELHTEEAVRAELSRKVEGQVSENKAIGTKIEKMQMELNKVHEETRAMEEKYNDGVAKIREDLKEMDDLAQKGNIREINKTLGVLELKYKDVEAKINAGSSRPLDSGERVGSNRYQIETATVDRLESSSAILGANLADLELKLQLLENTLYEGRQLWKVDNVAFRKSQAVNGKVTALHSAPCFQKRGGYKYCLRLYLNGDGMGKGTHVSLFFVVMKSEYDALLKWPFTEKVTFRLINPFKPEDTIPESFYPDPDSSSFKRPVKDMNIAAGCPKLVRQDRLHEYIVDDSFYVECVIGEQ